jgi:phage terminase large subunit-like protein
MEKNLVHGPGDYFGKPFRLAPYARKFIWRAYELNADGSRRFTRALLGVAKGNAKTEYAAAIAVAELGGPVMFSHWDAKGRPVGKRRVSPEIPVAAASFDQADLLFGAAKEMIKNGPLVEFFDPYDTEILVKGQPGKIYRVAAVAGTNDGARPTFFPGDELHEWTGNKERVHLILSNGRAKRADSWELGISTAGWDTGSLLGRMYAHGKRVAAGEVEDGSLLFVWYEPSGDVDLTDPIALRKAIREANPAADTFLNVEAVAARATQIPEFEFRRYHLNQWVDSPERWLPYGTFEACVAPEVVPPADGEEVVLFLSGTYDSESLGIVGSSLPVDAETPRPHLFVVHAWEKGHQPDWKVSTSEVEDALRNACQRWQVRKIGMDPSRWRSTIQRLEEEGLPVVAWESHLPSRMVPACAQFYDAVRDGQLSQDGDTRLKQHIGNAMVKVDSRGPRITREHKTSDRHIDLAVCAVGAYDLALREIAAGSAWSPVE